MKLRHNDVIHQHSDESNRESDASRNRDVILREDDRKGNDVIAIMTSQEKRDNQRSAMERERARERELRGELFTEKELYTMI